MECKESKRKTNASKPSEYSGWRKKAENTLEIVQEKLGHKVSGTYGNISGWISRSRPNASSLSSNLSASSNQREQRSRRRGRKAVAVWIVRLGIASNEDKVDSRSCFVDGFWSRFLWGEEVGICSNRTCAWRRRFMVTGSWKSPPTCVIFAKLRLHAVWKRRASEETLEPPEGKTRKWRENNQVERLQFFGTREPKRDKIRWLWVQRLIGFTRFTIYWIYLPQ